MTQVLDPATMIEAAQTAVAAGDYPTAERLLREAASLQETTHGSSHPDLASTLNKLALVYEQTNQIAEAEQTYRRAHAVAVASLLPGHPFVATSLKNLVDFCEAHEIPLWRPPAARLDDEFDSGWQSVALPDVAKNRKATTSEVDSLDAEFGSEAAPVATAVATPTRHRRIALVALAAAAIVVVSIVMRWSEASPASGSPAPAVTTPVAAGDAAPAKVTERVPVLTDAPAPPARAAAVAPAAPVERVERHAPRETRDTSVPVTVLTAQLCRAIEKRGSPDWQCASASGDVQPGKYSFYTRLQTNRDTMVEHRWYRDERVHQVSRLHIVANPGSGYRTFSSTTISAERIGNWKVELRAADGTLLHEEHFVAR